LKLRPAFVSFLPNRAHRKIVNVSRPGTRPVALRRVGTILPVLSGAAAALDRSGSASSAGYRPLISGDGLLFPVTACPGPGLPDRRPIAQLGIA